MQSFGTGQFYMAAVLAGSILMPYLHLVCLPVVHASHTGCISVMCSCLCSSAYQEWSYTARVYCNMPAQIMVDSNAGVDLINQKFAEKLS